MKKIIGALMILVFLIVIVYFIYPARPIISQSRSIHATTEHVAAFTGSQVNWLKWWPHLSSNRSDSAAAFICDGYTYRIRTQLYAVTEIDIIKGRDTFFSTLSRIPLRTDSTKVTWEVPFKSTNNPIRRIVRTRQSRELRQSITLLLEHLARFVEDEKNIYGIRIEKTKVKDTSLIVASLPYQYPLSTAVLYRVIDSLQQKIVEQGGKISAPPMLNVDVLDSSTSVAMVAIPVSTLPAPASFTFKRMVPGNILVTEIVGGPHTISEGYKKLVQYFGDHRMESPAIPFQSLVTDRSRQPDTTKWVTRLYYPVF